jgi:hypothetical protein
MINARSYKDRVAIGRRVDPGLNGRLVIRNVYDLGPGIWPSHRDRQDN